MLARNIVPRGGRVPVVVVVVVFVVVVVVETIYAFLVVYTFLVVLDRRRMRFPDLLRNTLHRWFNQTHPYLHANILLCRNSMLKQKQMFKNIGMMAYTESIEETQVGFKISPRMTMHAWRSARIGHKAEDRRNMTTFKTTNTGMMTFSSCLLPDGKKLSEILDATLIASLCRT